MEQLLPACGGLRVGGDLVLSADSFYWTV